MDIDVLYKALYIVVPIITLVVGGYMRSVVSRLEKLEDRALEFTTHKDVQEEISVRLDPVSSSIEELKIKIDKIYDYLITSRKNRGDI